MSKGMFGRRLAESQDSLPAIKEGQRTLVHHPDIMGGVDTDRPGPRKLGPQTLLTKTWKVLVPRHWTQEQASQFLRRVEMAMEGAERDLAEDLEKINLGITLESHF
jgi:hypothetical protein